MALVTGGSRGIGLGIALALAHAGADVALVSRTASDFDRASQMVQAIGRRVLAVPADMTAEDAPVRVVEHARDRFGRLDIVVTRPVSTCGSRPSRSRASSLRRSCG